MVNHLKYVDVNVFVYWLGGHPIFGEKAYKWIKNISETSHKTYVTSTLTIYETLLILAGLTGKNLGDKKFVEEVFEALTSLKGLTFENLEETDFNRALNLLKKFKLGYEDALHLAVAFKVKAKEIISNDKDFDKTTIKRRF